MFRLKINVLHGTVYTIKSSIPHLCKVSVFKFCLARPQVKLTGIEYLFTLLTLVLQVLHVYWMSESIFYLQMPCWHSSSGHVQVKYWLWPKIHHLLLRQNWIFRVISGFICKATKAAEQFSMYRVKSIDMLELDLLQYENIKKHPITSCNESFCYSS